MSEPIRVLFVEDSADDVLLLVRVIEKNGYKAIWKRVDTEVALKLAVRQEHWDIVVCDYNIPLLSCEAALQVVLDTGLDLPFIIVSGVVTEQAAMPLVEQGAVDFISKERIFRLPLTIKRELREVSTRMKQRMIIEQAFTATVIAWGTALELRDHNTHGHTLRVTNHAINIATRNNVPHNVLRNVYFGALLHDVGKIGIPDRILLKATSLSEEEWIIMKSHTTLAYNFLKDIPFLGEAVMVPYCHHERWDGSGYPQGLKGEAIPLCARIFALADVYDALTTDRPYRKALKHKIAIGVMREMKHFFDPKLFADFMDTEGEAADVR